MAPIPPLGKKRVLELLRAGQLPIHFGSPHPFVAVVAQDGAFRVRELAVDPREEEVARGRSLAAGRGWSPEQHYELGRPAGRIFLEAETPEGLAALIEGYAWPASW